MLRDQLLDRVEPDGENDGIAVGDGGFHGRGARERSELAGERFRVRLILGGHDDGLAAGDQMAGDGAADVADADDCGCHCDSSLETRAHLSLTSSESSPKAW